MKWLYLALNLGSAAVPFLFSFDKRLGFRKTWKFLVTALVCTAAFFLVWDFWFTQIGIWKFNYDYVLGITLVNLPMEEWMFFICIPFACIFTHEALKYLLPKVFIDNLGKEITIVLLIFCLIMIVLYHNQNYTCTTFLLLGIMLCINQFVLKAKFMGRFYFSYLVSCIPFAIVNGFLTAMPVLIYNNSENCGIRVGTIPAEDFFYSMLMLLMNITIFERLKNSNA